MTGKAPVLKRHDSVTGLKGDTESTNSSASTGSLVSTAAVPESLVLTHVSQEESDRSYELDIARAKVESVTSICESVLDSWHWAKSGDRCFDPSGRDTGSLPSKEAMNAEHERYKRQNSLLASLLDVGNCLVDEIDKERRSIVEGKQRSAASIRKTADDSELLKDLQAMFDLLTQDGKRLASALSTTSVQVSGSHSCIPYSRLY